MKFSQSHVWIKSSEDGNVLVGLSKYIKNNLGEILYIDLPSIGEIFEMDDILAVVESSKAAIEIPSPIFGKVIAVNDALRESALLLNEDPEGEGYLVLMELLGEPVCDDFCDAETYYLMNS